VERVWRQLFSSLYDKLPSAGLNLFQTPVVINNHTNYNIQIEKYRGSDSNSAQPSKESFAKWSFGKSLDRSDLQFGYQMKVLLFLLVKNLTRLISLSLTNKFVHTPHTETYLEWQFAGEC